MNDNDNINMKENSINDKSNNEVNDINIIFTKEIENTGGSNNIPKNKIENE